MAYTVTDKSEIIAHEDWHVSRTAIVAVDGSEPQTMTFRRGMNNFRVKNGIPLFHDSIYRLTDWPDTYAPTPEELHQLVW